MMDMNDVIMSLGGVEKITSPCDLNVSDADLLVHLSNNVVGTSYTVAQIRAQIPVYTTKMSEVLINSQVDAQIESLEGKTERGIREAILFLTAAEAAQLGMTEPQLYAANYGYRKAKDLDTAIAALRAQRV